MIPEHNKEVFIDCIGKGGTFEQACAMAQISRPSAFRFLKNPALKKRYDEALFEAKDRLRKKADQEVDKGMQDLKKMIKNRKI